MKKTKPIRKPKNKGMKISAGQPILQQMPWKGK